ncbi:MAG: PAS domain-containing sensor histidine kinase, partial [Thermodesulfobacteriota bacterium]|nr:PAS domain-containing sensor histidine kinase [Thermodesulfobacteriota bacterium]
MNKKKRLIWQIYPSYLLIALISMVAVTWYASHSVRHFFFEQTATDLEARARLVEKHIIENFDPPEEKIIDSLCKRLGVHSSTRITVVLPSGKVIGDSSEDPETMDNHIDRPEIIKAMKGGEGNSIRFSRTRKKSMMYVGIPLRNESRIVGVVRTSIPLNSIDDAIQNVQIKIVMAGLLIAVFVTLVSLWVSHR